MRNQTTAFIGETCCNEARMETIRGHARALQAPSKFARKQDVAELRATISPHGSEALRGLKIVEIKVAP